MTNSTDVSGDVGAIQGVTTTTGTVKVSHSYTTSIHERLREEFPPSVIKKLPKGGKDFDYIPVADIIERLNLVLGYNGWSHRITKTWREKGIDNDNILVTCELTVGSCTKEAVGGQVVRKGMDLGDLYKSAMADALKKAAQLFSVGIYLARSEESLMEEGIEVTHKEYDILVQRAGALSEETRKVFKEFWKARRGDLSREGLSRDFYVELCEILDGVREFPTSEEPKQAPKKTAKKESATEQVDAQTS